MVTDTVGLPLLSSLSGGKGEDKVVKFDYLSFHCNQI